jgi:hypothetical protein
MSKVLTSNDLVERTRLRGMLPTNDVTYSDDNLLNLLNEEMDTYGVEQLLTLHENYLVYYEDQAIDPNKKDYVIPYRAIVDKLKEVELVDSSGNIYECSQIELSQAPDFQSIFNLKKTNVFYLKNNYVTFQNGFPVNTGFLRFYFYLRPNKLVKNSRGAVISAINRATGVITVSNFPDEFSSTSYFDFIAKRSPNKIYNYDIQAGAVNSGSKTLSFPVSKNASSINFTTGIFTVSSNNYYTGMSCVLSTTGAIPTGLSSGTVNPLLPISVQGTVYYVIKIDNNTFKLAASYDDSQSGTSVSFSDNGSGTLTISPTVTHIHSELIIGDYICLAEETIVPQLPVELHPILAQRVASLCLDALEGGPEAIKKRVKDMENSTNRILEHRAEDAPKKITQRKGILRQNYFKTNYRP